MAIATANGSPMQILRKALHLVAEKDEDDDRLRSHDPGFPTYELLLISIGFVAEVLVCMHVAMH